jgi:hypothetical protein
MGEAKRRRAAGVSQPDLRHVNITPYLRIPAGAAAYYHGLVRDLVKKAEQLQPSHIGIFTKHAAAYHEASHAVVAAREGRIVKSMRLWQQQGQWVGEYCHEGDNVMIDIRHEPQRMLTQLRIILAGRRGELMFEPRFCPHAGLEELGYCMIMVMTVFPALGLDPEVEYDRVWLTLTDEIDETLLRHKAVVHSLADGLLRDGQLSGDRLAAECASIAPRTEPPPLRERAVLESCRRLTDPLISTNTEARTTENER